MTEKTSNLLSISEVRTALHPLTDNQINTLGHYLRYVQEQGYGRVTVVFEKGLPRTVEFSASQVLRP